MSQEIRGEMARLQVAVPPAKVDSYRLDGGIPSNHFTDKDFAVERPGDAHMSSFDERESSFENKFKHDKELEFKATARRNKLLGLWAANLLGIHGAEAETYAKSVVKADMEKPGDSDVVEKILGDFKERGVDMSEHRLRKQMTELMTAAVTQIKSEV
jgi:hypothetical protein